MEQRTHGVDVPMAVTLDSRVLVWVGLRRHEGGSAPLRARRRESAYRPGLLARWLRLGGRILESQEVDPLILPDDDLCGANPSVYQTFRVGGRYGVGYLDCEARGNGHRKRPGL